MDSFYNKAEIRFLLESLSRRKDLSKLELRFIMFILGTERPVNRKALKNTFKKSSQYIGFCVKDLIDKKIIVEDDNDIITINKDELIPR